ncbi:MAG: hypothetical protein ACT4P3_02445 [Betaproteobacteria bacterium]
MRPVLRKSLMVLAVVGLAASVVAGREKPAGPVEPAARVDTRIRAGDELDLARLERRADEGASTDLFASRTFSDGKKISQKADKPAAPPLPFAYLGKVIEGGKVEIWLSRGGELLAVAPGDRIGADYRLDAAEGDTLAFTYLPLGQRQTMDLPKVNR